MIEFALAAHLIACSPVTALVGARVYADQAPQDAAKPYVVYRLLPGAQRHYHSLGASGLVEAAIEVVCHARSIEAARAVYEAVRNEVDGFQGEWSGTTVNRATLSTPASTTGNPVHGDEPGDPAVSANVNCFYYESVPTLAGPA